MAAPIYEEIQWLSPLFINFPDEKANKTIENFKEENQFKNTSEVWSRRWEPRAKYITRYWL